jgi:hypothetical protein
VRESVDEVKFDGGGEERLRVQYLWDYTAGQAIRRTYATDGTFRTAEPMPNVTLNATDRERDYAFGLVRAAPDLARRITPTTTLFGGFSFREPGHPDCDVGSRCIHVVGSENQGRRHVLHAIVDLMTGRVVDPEYDPGMRGIAQNRKKGDKIQ